MREGHDLAASEPRGRHRAMLALFILILLAGPVVAAAQVIEIVSVDSQGKPHPYADARGWDLDATGRFVAFSMASGFSQEVDPTCLFAHSYVRDRATGTIQCVPDSAGGGLISPDGQRVTYQINGTAVSCGTYGTFVYDLVDQTSTCVTLSSTGQPVPGGVHSMSADGRVVAFSSSATNVAAPCVQPLVDHYFVRDLAAGTTRCVDVSRDGSEAGNASAYSVSLSGDGRLVVFISGASNLGACVDPLFQVVHVFVRDRVTGAIACVDVAPDGSLADHGVYHEGARISASGRFVAFSSDSTNLAPPCGGARIGFEPIRHVYVRDLLLGRTVCASSGPAGPGNDHSGGTTGLFGFADGPSISADGRFVAFVSRASNLAAPCSGGWQVYVRDMALGTVVCVSVSAAGIPGDKDSDGPVLSGDGRFVVFGSESSNLLPGLTGHEIQALLARVPVAPRADLTVGVNLPSLGAGDTLVTTATLTPGPGPVDGYLVLRTPDGGFFSLTRAGIVPGIVPVARAFTPFAFTGELLRYVLTGQEPPGPYTWFSALTAAGTLTLVTDLHQTPFSILP